MSDAASKSERLRLVLIREGLSPAEADRFVELTTEISTAADFTGLFEKFTELNRLTDKIACDATVD